MAKKVWSAGEKVLAADLNTNFNIADGRKSLKLLETLSANAPVRILSNAGEAKIAGILGNSYKFEANSLADFHNADVNWIDACYDETNGKYVITYQLVSNGQGYAVVATPNLSAGTISFGTPVNFDTNTITHIKTEYDPSTGKVAIIYDNGTDGKVIIGTVSGTSISFGTAVTINTGRTYHSSTCYDPVAQRMIFIYRAGSTSGSTVYGKVGTISGTSISFGSAATVGTGAEPGGDKSLTDVTYSEGNSKIIVGYSNSGDSGRAYCRIGTVTGGGTNTISFGTDTLVSNDGTGAEALAVVAHGIDFTFFFAYSSGTSPQVGTHYHTGTISGTTPTFGGAKQTLISGFSTAANSMDALYDGANQRIIVSYNNPNVTDVFLRSMSIGTTAHTTDYLKTMFTDGNWNALAYSAVNGTMFAGRNTSTSRGRAVLNDKEYKTADYAGILVAGGNAGDTKEVAMEGAIIDSMTGLTPGATYYISSTGTLTTTKGPATAGKALSATEMLVKNSDKLKYIETDNLGDSAVTTINTWEDWDLSTHIPPGAIYAEILVYGSNLNYTHGVRENGSANDRSFTFPSAAQGGWQTTVPLDGNRIIERYAGNNAGGTVKFMVMGYWI
jgi:hypothetical protein